MARLMSSATSPEGRRSQTSPRVYSRSRTESTTISACNGNAIRTAASMTVPDCGTASTASRMVAGASVVIRPTGVVSTMFTLWSRASTVHKRLANHDTIFMGR